MRRPGRHFGDEKAEEKQEEKEEEKGSEKRGFYGEKWVRDQLASITWGLIIVWAGLVFLLASLGTELLGIIWSNTWSWILLGAGVILGLEILLRLVLPEYRRPVRGRLILAVILFAIGLGGVIRFDITWPFILIVIGIIILVSAFQRPKR